MDGQIVIFQKIFLQMGFFLMVVENSVWHIAKTSPTGVQMCLQLWLYRA